MAGVAALGLIRSRGHAQTDLCHRQNSSTAPNIPASDAKCHPIFTGGEENELLAGKSGATRLGFALLLTRADGR
ncbi:hypothetical protein [Nonomuraea sp. 3N208]|uniref:hypothetical protein n=1 Tax=Nonomuraea sp. 3N208 TaxID=3457421 RepID=UPI003FD05A91